MPKATTKKLPDIVATTSVVSLMLATMFTSPTTTGTVEQGAYLAASDFLVRYVNDGFVFSTASNSIMAYEHIEQPTESAKFAAYEMFGEMRHPTQEEQDLYDAMLFHMSTPIDVDIFAL